MKKVFNMDFQKRKKIIPHPSDTEIELMMT